jgi:hypothetical protein
MCCKSACFHLSAGRDVDLYNSVLISLQSCVKERHWKRFSFFPENNYIGSNLVIICFRSGIKPKDLVADQAKRQYVNQQPPSRTAGDAQKQATEMTTTDFSLSGCRAVAFLPLLAASLTLSWV